MDITMSAIEGTLIVAAGIIPLILLLGSIEKLLALVDEYRYRRRVRKQLRLIRQNFQSRIHDAA
ncbi:hypothetical protein [Salinispira pacifica]|uniref:Uncharacterized protein n=1 Tax=Salinispira pacifica TaxID=1307761 RepID=V5WFU1_9SPIO|nr:hypothetical protein [Salinispira pacifica]AHC14697.1 hypothetical protein L21SP2_1296 [Salinispira pacifica]